jgi:hypothetical protein
MHKGELAHGEW